jgi:adenine specific DNA methylase Mod
MAWTNQLYYGDNLQVLRKYVRDESVDLCYIDPPFNSKKNYNQIYDRGVVDDKAQAQAFIDTWEWDRLAQEGLAEILGNEAGRFTPESIELIKGFRNVLTEDSLLAYLVSMTLRVTEIYRALKPTGSFYLHCDPTASHYLKLLMDSVFGPLNFRNEIIWKRTSAHISSKRYDTINDILLFFSKTDLFT